MAEADMRMIRDCVAVVRMRVDQAESRVATAIRDLARAEADAAAADTAVDAAAGEWQRQMREGFDPMLGTGLAREVLACVETARIAGDGRLAAEHARAASLQGWRLEDARRGGLDAAADAARRRHDRHREDRDLAVLADRETMKWMHP